MIETREIVEVVNITVADYPEVVNITIDEVEEFVNISLIEIIEAVNITVIEEETSILIEVSESGAQGVKGMSAYEIAVKNGFLGNEPQWLKSLMTNSIIDGGAF